ncbi:hydrogenase maturation nickel metallochaperone HypA [Kitasatospora sp. NPDC053057]|uniref:hydrogenase maturation nickel metallochaperone HypA n=1 Tax=Kitasatospora sp. NPDC053057 TaxID=3364062 RepID=UPI0037C61943
MHEMSIAAAVVEQVDTAAREHGAPGVARVRLRVGELAGVVPEALDFCFELACAGTLVEGAALDTESVTARARCAPCGVEWAVGMPPDLGCPGCRSGGGVELLSGRELQILDVEWAGRPGVRAEQKG